MLNAGYFGANRTKLGTSCIFILHQLSCRPLQVVPLSAPKQTRARIDYLRQVGRLVDCEGTHNVKIFAEKTTLPPFEEQTLSRCAC